jgi:DNA ligase 1
MITEAQMTLGRDYQHGDKLTGWLLSEKLDGCRGYWDGSRCWTRGGNLIDLPANIRASLPAGFALDGELWAGHGRFTAARCAVQFNRWTPTCQFIAFDAPEVKGTWPERIAEAAGRYGDVIGYTAFKSTCDLNLMLAEIQAAGGEGIVARHPAAIEYERGRTRNLLKIKVPIY